MTEKSPRSFRKPLVRTFLIIAAVFAVVILGVHIWFVNNARGILKEIVLEKSHGHIKLELSHLSFDFFSNKLQIKEADLRTTDSITQAVGYHVQFRKLTLRIHSFWPLLLQKKLLLDSIKLHDPEIAVIQWRLDTSTRVAHSDLSVPQEMGKLYNSMLDVLEAFGIRRIIINNAKLSLINRIHPEKKPVVVSRIYFDLMRSDKTLPKRDQYLENEQNISLRTTNQDIDLPSGRHRLSFKTFNLQLFQKRVELDSCTVTAFPTDSSKSNYRIFFDKLMLVGVDFDAMYRYNLIRADSVYCVNPFFNINIYSGDATERKATATKPDLEKLVRELTGDLDLAFVGVKDAGIHINMTGSKTRSLFNSSKDNFEMRGFRINADSSKPVAVTRFDMLVRDYHLYNADSSTAYSFDSIRFLNNRIVLSNFSVVTQSGNNKQRSQRDFKIPHFELSGLDWYELVFEQNLQANEAALYDPVINFKRNVRIIHKKGGIFSSLRTLDSLMALDKVKIVNGQVNMMLGPSRTFQFKDLDLSLYSNDLMKSRNREGLRRAVEYLSFSSGLIRFNDITAQLRNIKYTGKNLIHADQLLVTSSINRVNASAEDVYIDNMLIDEKAETILVDGLRWKKASVALRLFPAVPGKKHSGRMLMKNISGRNTRLQIAQGPLSVSVALDAIGLKLLSRMGNAPVRMEGLLISGNDLRFSGRGSSLRTASFTLSGTGGSVFRDLKFEQVKGRDSIDLSVPRLDFIADMNAILAKDMHLTDVRAQAPLIHIRKWNEDPSGESNGGSGLRIDHIIVEDPDISIALHKEDSVRYINIPRSGKARVRTDQLVINDKEVRLGTLELRSNSVSLVKPSGDTLGVIQGKADIGLREISLPKTGGKPAWSFGIDHIHLEHPEKMAFGPNKKLNLDRFSVGNLRMSSAYFTDFNQLIRSNISAWLRSVTGSYSDSAVTLNWYNAEYLPGKKTMKLDSFSYRPSMHRDSLIRSSPYQVDYIQLNTGPLVLSGLNLEQFEKDSALNFQKAEIMQPYISIYRDKQPPLRSGVVRPLPVDMLKNIPFPVAIEQVKLVNGELSYTERNAKTRAEGTLLLKRLNGGLTDIRNRNLDAHDSLILTLSAYLMDSAYLDLRVKESYMDSLSGFLMTLRMTPTSLTFLNPVLVPLSNVKISSGTIDSFHLRAIGREYAAVGEMKMYYHDLRIQLIKRGDPNRSTFLDKVVTSLINTFLVKKNNNGRVGLVYFQRLRDRSFFNYVVKTAFSGIATSIGVKKNGKYLRQYRKEIKNGRLPEMTFN